MTKAELQEIKAEARLALVHGTESRFMVEELPRLIQALELRADYESCASCNNPMGFEGCSGICFECYSKSVA